MRPLATLAALLALAAVSSASGASDSIDGLRHLLPASFFDCDESPGGDVPVPGRPGLRLHARLTCPGDVPADPSGGGGLSAAALTECPSPAHVRSPYRLADPYVAIVQRAASGEEIPNTANPSTWVYHDLQSVAQAWDSFTGAKIHGNLYMADALDPVSVDVRNQIRWTQLPLGQTQLAHALILSFQGLVVEADIEFNERYPWSTNTHTPAELAGYYVVSNVAAHEFGHVFGLDHVATTSANQCLTMYPTSGFGEVQKESPGDGDILGLRAIYGP